MDEVLFRGSQKVENIQLQAQLVAAKTKDVLVLYSQQAKLFVLQLLDSTTAEQIKINAAQFYDKVVYTAKGLQGFVIYHANPRHIYHALIKVFGKKWTNRDICFGCAGLLIGGVIGVTVGLSLRKKEPILRYMQAVQCSNYIDAESVTVVEDAIAPYECGEYDVLINVKAASIQIIDTQICTGYGSILRRILQRICYRVRSELPVILGRECSGIITDIGCKVKRLEVGDEVWLAVPFWHQGTLCQTVLVPENWVSKKPKNIGFEGACSLPYAGSLALSALKQANLDSSNAHNKKILVQGGCTPVGCILIQLLKHWKAMVTTTCQKKALPVVQALGACDIIVLSESAISNKESGIELNTTKNQQVLHYVLLKELELRGEIYDIIIKTSNEYNIDQKDLIRYCKTGSTIISTLLPQLWSDSCGFFSETALSLYVRFRYQIQSMLGLPLTDFDETHLCYVTLEKLAEFVEDGYLQTVVDKVILPHDIEIAINHIQSLQSIGSTVVTFR